MESALSLFKQLPENKSEVESYTRIIRNEVLAGNINPLAFIRTVTALEKLFANLKNDILIKDTVLQEAEKYGKNFDEGGANFNIREVGVTYDYKGCGDVDWEQMDSAIKDMTEKKKARETFLKSLTGEMEVFGADGCQILPALKKSTTQVVVTLK